MFFFKLALFFCAIYLGQWFIQWRRRRKRLVDLANKLPGPGSSSIPMVEIAMIILQCQEFAKRFKVDSYVFAYAAARAVVRAYQGVGLFRLWLGFKPVVVLFSPETIEPIVTNPRVLNKSDEYFVFEPWIGEGLVTSKRTKWQFRRKILTPAFHFRILGDFLPVINQEATRFVQKLNQVKYFDGRRVNIMPLVALCTLDTICETAMGTSLESQASEEESPYVRALYEVGEMALARVTRPWLWPDFAFYRTHFGRKFIKARDLMHAFTSSVIEDRKKEWQEILKASSSDGRHGKISLEDSLQLKFARRTDKRMAFLDLIMHEHLVEKSMSLSDVQEEVDTFMFAVSIWAALPKPPLLWHHANPTPNPQCLAQGHDTTAMNINWALYMLGLNKEIQNRARAEVDQVMGSERSTSDPENGQDGGNELSSERADKLAKRLDTADISLKHLRELKYLEQVIKETLRMWPSIPFVARQMTEDVLVGANNEYLLPEGSTCMIFTHELHNNPNYFPRPERFDPERFSPEQTAQRHPFAYIPFSAGPRNCIGQKYAQMEVKIILAKLIRNYYFESCDPIDKLHVVGELVLRPTNGLYVRIRPRFCS